MSRLLLAVILSVCVPLALASVVPDTIDNGDGLTPEEHAAHSTDLYWDGVLPTNTSIHLNLPPRYMWGWGPGLHGYCGSTSTQTAALYFGTWISLEYVRYAAGNVEVLIERDHVDLVADVFKLRMTVFDNDWRETSDGEWGEGSELTRFYNWMYRNMHQGHVTIGGWYEYNTKALTDDDYDHIVPMPGMTWNGTGSMSQVKPASEDFTVTSIFYNNLWSNTTAVRLPPLATDRKSYYSAEPTPQPYRFKLPDAVNYGFAVEGLYLDGGCDQNNRIYRTMLHSSNWTEPDYGAEDHRDEGNADIWFAATVFDLEKGATYAVLRFDGNESIPTRDFINQPYQGRVDFTAVGPVHFLPKMATVKTNNVYSYRTVMITAAPVANQAVPCPAPSQDPIVVVSAVIGVLGILGFVASSVMFVTWRRSGRSRGAVSEVLDEEYATFAKE